MQEEDDKGMKKYIALFVSTAVLLTAAFFIPSWIKNGVPAVSVTTVKRSTYTDTVSASGMVEYKDKKEITLSLPVVPGQVFVEVGDEVKIGDVLAVIDKEQTCAAAVNVIGLGENIPSEWLAAFGQSDLKLSDLLSYLPDEIVADANGVIGDLTLTEGAVALPNTVLATISNSGTLQAKVSVGEAVVSNVKEGQKVSLSSTALKGKKFQGTVRKIYPSARKQYVGTTQETVVDVLIDFDNPDKAIKSGFTVKADIQTAPEESLYTLPYDCVEQDEKGEYVYVYQAGKAFQKYIKTGRELTDGLEVLSGIALDDWVITKPDAVRHNSFVRIS